MAEYTDDSQVVPPDVLDEIDKEGVTGVTLLGGPELALVKVQNRPEVASLFKWLDNIKVENDDDQKNFEDCLAAAKSIKREVTGIFEQAQEPAKKELEIIRVVFKPFLDGLTAKISACSDALSTYQRQKVEEAQRKQTEELKALEEQRKATIIDESTGEVVEVEEVTPVEITPSVSGLSRGNLANTNYKTNYDITIINPKLVPRDLCEPSLKLIRMRVKSGVTSIPGCLIKPIYNIASIKKG